MFKIALTTDNSIVATDIALALVKSFGSHTGAYQYLLMKQIPKLKLNEIEIQNYDAEIAALYSMDTIEISNQFYQFLCNEVNGCSLIKSIFLKNNGNVNLETVFKGKYIQIILRGFTNSVKIVKKTLEKLNIKCK